MKRHSHEKKAGAATEFQSYRSYQEFALSVARRWRYSRTPEDMAFLQTVLETSAGREKSIPAGRILFRAQKDCDSLDEEIDVGVTVDVPVPHAPDRMKPAVGRAQEGRANAKGIPCLYAASDEITAICEVRPWVGAHVSVAQMRINRRLRVVDFATHDRRLMVYFGEPNPRERQRAVWRDIGRAFSRPVSPSDDMADYAPTQVIAETFRKQGFDGVTYRSAFGQGVNAALFDPNVADVVSCSLFEVSKVHVKYAPAANSYVVRPQRHSGPKRDAGNSGR